MWVKQLLSLSCRTSWGVPDTLPLSPAAQQLRLGAEELRINPCLQPGWWLECKCLNFGEVTSVKWFNAVCCQELMNSVLQQVVP